MINRIQQAIARLLTPWRTIRQLESEVERLKKILDNPYLAGVQIGRETGIEVEMKGSGPQLLAGMFEGLLEKDGANAPNYLELQFHTRHQGLILVHVQRLHGQSPHALRVRAEQRADAWQAMAEQLMAAAQPILDCVCAGDLDEDEGEGEVMKAALETAIRQALARKAYEAGRLTDGPAVPHSGQGAGLCQWPGYSRPGDPAMNGEPPVRYVLHPGHVLSATDGQTHFINGARLAVLYGLNLRDYQRAVFAGERGYRELPGDVHLYPRRDGNYTLPHAAPVLDN